VELLWMSSFLIEQGFADRLFSGRPFEVLRRLRGRGLTVILPDGDVIFEPRKVEQRVYLRVIRTGDVPYGRSSR
jgi:hypothetical protein